MNRNIHTIFAIMFRVIYTLTPEILSTIKQIDKIRDEILTRPLSPQNERRLRWSACIERLYWIQDDPERSFSKEHIRAILLSNTRLAQTQQGIRLLNYLHGIELISENQILNDSPVVRSHIEDLALLLDRRITRPTHITLGEDMLSRLLTYLNTSEDNPIITSSIAFSQWCILTRHTKSQPMAFLIAYIFLYRGGFTVRHALSLESALNSLPREFNHAMSDLAATETSTEWIRFYAASMLAHLKSIRNSITDNERTRKTSNEHFRLTPRQVHILTFLDGLESLTNKQIQKHFRVSQATASRDLAQLTSLRLLLCHGKGRSVYYTKA